MTVRGEDPWRRKATMPLEKAATIRRELEPDLDTAAVAEKGPKKKPRQKKGGTSIWGTGTAFLLIA